MDSIDQAVKSFEALGFQDTRIGEQDELRYEKFFKVDKGGFPRDIVYFLSGEFFAQNGQYQLSLKGVDGAGKS